MTIGSCMDFVDTVMPNSLPPEVKLRFLGEAEGRVRVELLGEAPDGGADFGTATPKDTPLSAPHPYDQIYWLYLMAMMDYVGGNAARFENTASLFNAAFRDYGKYLKRRGA